MRNEEWNCPNNLEKNFLWLSTEKQVEDEEEAEEKPDVQK